MSLNWNKDVKQRYEKLMNEFSDGHKQKITQPQFLTVLMDTYELVQDQIDIKHQSFEVKLKK